MGKLRQLLPSRSETLGRYWHGSQGICWMQPQKPPLFAVSIDTLTWLAKTSRDHVSCMYISRCMLSTQQRLAACALQELRACRCLGSCTHISALLRDMAMLLGLGWRHRVLEVSHISLLAMSRYLCPCQSRSRWQMIGLDYAAGIAGVSQTMKWQHPERLRTPKRSIAPSTF